MKDTQHSAAALYDGGWTSADSDQLMQEYALTQDEADALCTELKRIEDNA